MRRPIEMDFLILRYHCEIKSNPDIATRKRKKLNCSFGLEIDQFYNIIFQYIKKHFFIIGLNLHKTGDVIITKDA